MVCFSGGLERVKTELREEVSGHSSVSDVDSDSDSPTEVNTEQSNSIRCLNTVISTLERMWLKQIEMNLVVC